MERVRDSVNEIANGAPALVMDVYDAMATQLKF
jgi:hypothetical protein